MTVPVIRPARPDDAGAMARVHVDTWRTTYVGIISDEYLAKLSYDRSEALWLEVLSDPKSTTHAFVAEDENGQVVGLASGGHLREPLNNYDGELYVVYVRQSFQGSGCGKRLIARVAEDLLRTGCRSLVIWVLKENPACRFYERLGGTKAAEKVIEIGGKELVDVAYVWPDLARLIENSQPVDQN